MTHKDGNESDNDEVQNQMMSQETVLAEEIRILRQQMTEMYEAWMSGQAPPPSIRDYLNINMSPPVQVSISDPIYPPGFGPASNVAGTSTVHPLNTPMTSNPLFIPTAPTNVVQQPIMEPKSNNDPLLKVQYDRDYTPELTFKIPSSYPHTHQYSSHVEAEKSVRDMQGLGGHKSVSFNDLCMFPHVHLPIDFKTPKFEKYDGHGDPVAHLKRYCNQLRGAGSKEELLMAYFRESLMGIASEWFLDQDTSNWHTWDDLARCFVQQFQYNIDIIPDRTSLVNMRKRTIENFREYAIRWREQAARVKPPMKKSEMIDVFLHAQEPNYFHYLLSVVGKTFAEVIKIGEMVENGIKSGKIVSQAALKATTQVIKNGSGNFGGKKMKEDVANVVSGTQKSPRGPPYQSAPPQYHHYLPMQDTQYSVVPPQYAVYNAQQYAYPPNYPQWQAPTYQNVHSSSQNFRAPYNLCPRQGFGGGQRPRNNFTPIGESYTSLFNKLKHLKIIEPIPQNYVDPHTKGFNPTARCAYHSDAPGHSIEDCRDFKKKVEEIIQTKMIVVQNDDPQMLLRILYRRIVMYTLSR
ncbi:uncharacterized protein LOC125836336 [Solanum verrucosum]|uniref:uncharacterized protein LOC125836336 n=1 Tax=Solanum verrucosum TaxID=315347 RepID=UPI0020D154A1|nr:uncharacterized protein LOC125836336 [Solanum verrucosum]